MKKFFKNHGKKAGWIILAAIVLAILVGGAVYTINEQEQAVVTTFGVAKAVTEPGLHVKIPFIQKVKKVDTTIQGFAVGFDQMGQALE